MGFVFLEGSELAAKPFLLFVSHMFDVGLRLIKEALWQWVGFLVSWQSLP